jgi:hypothetical protein
MAVNASHELSPGARPRELLTPGNHLKGVFRLMTEQPPSAGPFLQILFRGPHGRETKIDTRVSLSDIATDPYVLLKTWRGLPRAPRSAMARAGLDARGFANNALTLCRQLAAGVPLASLQALRFGPGLTLGLVEACQPASLSKRVVIMRHPEWTGPETLVEGRFHSI